MLCRFAGEYVRKVSQLNFQILQVSASTDLRGGGRTLTRVFWRTFQMQQQKNYYKKLCCYCESREYCVYTDRCVKQTWSLVSIFTVSNWSRLLMPVSFLDDRCVLSLNDTSYSKSIWRSEQEVPWTRRYNFQPLTPTLSGERYRPSTRRRTNAFGVRDRQTNRQSDDSITPIDDDTASSSTIG